MRITSRRQHKTKQVPETVFNIVTDLSPLIKQTSDLLNVDPNLVYSVVDYQFEYLHNQFFYPTAVSMHYPQLGSFVLKSKMCRHLIIKFIQILRRLRTNPTKIVNGKPVTLSYGRWYSEEDLISYIRHCLAFRDRTDKYRDSLYWNPNMSRMKKGEIKLKTKLF